jgi:glucuronide carrier protein
MSFAEPLKWRSVVGYGLGDAANNFVFSMGLLFLLPYYTDVAGIGAAAAGALLMAARFYAAAMDLVAGQVVDSGRFATRRGRFRPWLLWIPAPLLLLNAAVFSVPSGWSAEWKLVYAYTTYALLETTYSFVKIPYGALATVMTQQPRERSRLAAARTLASTGAILLLGYALGPALHELSCTARRCRTV